jgi:hypothetical protein
MQMFKINKNYAAICAELKRQLRNSAAGITGHVAAPGRGGRQEQVLL